jgi:hypothetical protein
MSNERSVELPHRQTFKLQWISVWPERSGEPRDDKTRPNLA